MWWRLPRSQFVKQKGAGNKRAFKRIVDAGEAVRYAQARGVRVVEGYPVEPRRGSMPDAFAWTGTASAFRRAGFVEVLRRSATRPIMRFVPGGDSG